MQNSKYAFSRDSSASVRLYLQHYMWRHQLNYHLHPDIPVDRTGLKIADVGCGTGIWLTELAGQVSSSCQLDGYDISADQFPPKAWWPRNVNFSVHDALAPISDDMAGSYDIVHVGLLVMIVKNEDPVPLLENLLSMLKPGGYLQWDEADCNSMKASAANPSTPITHSNDLIYLYHNSSKCFKLTYSWVSKMDHLFQENNVQMLSYQRFPISDAIAKPWTGMMLMGIEDAIANMTEAYQDETEQGVPSLQQRRDIFERAAEERKQGVSIRMDMISAVGRKHMN